MAENSENAALAPSATPKGPLLLALLNSVVILGALGMLAYTRLIYHRPAITEESERERLAEETKAPPIPNATPGSLAFEPMTINIQAAPATPRPDELNNRQIQGKLHYATVAFTLEVRDMGFKEQIEEIRPVLMDRILTLMGKKPFHELTTVQGRYLLRSQILDMANELARAPQNQAPLLSDVFFTQFVVQ